MLGLPKLNICVSVLGRLPHCIVSAQILFLEVLGLPKLILSVSSFADCLFAFVLPQKLFLEVLGLPKLNILVIVLGRLPICVFSAPSFLLRCWACLS